MTLINLHPKTLFPGQQPTETIYLVTRPHWFTLAKKIAVWGIFLVLLFFIDNLILPVFPVFADAPYSQIIGFIRTIYLMFLAVSLMAIWVVYYLNFQVVTNERIVDMDQYSILHHQTSELNISMVEDVTAEIKGIAGTFLNFGNVYIQTAGQTRMFEFDHVPDPHRVANLILTLFERHQKRHLGRGGDNGK